MRIKNVLRFFGHAERMSDERMVQKDMTRKVSGKRSKKRRPRLTFENSASKILEEKGKKHEELQEFMTVNKMFINYRPKSSLS